MAQSNTDRHWFYSYTKGYEVNTKVLLAKTQRRYMIYLFSSTMIDSGMLMLNTVPPPS